MNTRPTGVKTTPETTIYLPSVDRQRIESGTAKHSINIVKANIPARRTTYVVYRRPGQRPELISARASFQAIGVHRMDTGWTGMRTHITRTCPFNNSVRDSVTWKTGTRPGRVRPCELLGGITSKLHFQVGRETSKRFLGISSMYVHRSILDRFYGFPRRTI